jgi:hypothetical protein
MLVGILDSTDFVGSYPCSHIAADSHKPVRLSMRNTRRRPPVPSAQALTLRAVNPRREFDIFNAGAGRVIAAMLSALRGELVGKSFSAL